MEKQFELTLTNNYKNILVGVGTLVFMWVVGVQGGSLVASYAGWLASARTLFTTWMVVVVGGGFLGMFLVARKVGGVPTRIIVAADELRALNHKTGTETCVAYASIASYGTSFFNGTEELRLELRTDKQLKLAVNTNFQDFQLNTFWEMVRAFEAALARYQARQQPGVASVSLKEKEFVFFASALSTIVLVLLAGGWGLAAWLLSSHQQAIGSGFFLLCFGGIVYGALWYNSCGLRRRE